MNLLHVTILAVSLTLAVSLPAPPTGPGPNEQISVTYLDVDGVLEYDPLASQQPQLVNVTMSGKIHGGIKATKNEFPYMLHMESFNRDGKGAACGASIISKKYALTAAHCIVKDFVKIRLYAGYINRRKHTGGEYMVQGAKVMMYGFSWDPPRNDIAIVEIAGEFTNTDGSKAIPLPSDNEALPSGYATISGWGETDVDKSGDLQKLEVKLVPDEQCKKMWGSAFDETQFLCAGDVKGKNVCYGDSGGPLVAGGKQVGVRFRSGSSARPHRQGTLV